MKGCLFISLLYFELSDVTSRDGQPWCLRSSNRFQTSNVKTDSRTRPRPRPRPSPKCIKQTALLSHFLDVPPPNPSEMHSWKIEEKQAHTILAQPSTKCHISDGQLLIFPPYFLITSRFVIMFSFSGLSLDFCPIIFVRADPSSPFIIQVSLISSSISLDN